MKNLFNLIFVAFTLMSTTLFAQLPNLSVFINQTNGSGCSNQTDCADGLLCFDVGVTVDQDNWLLQAYNIWIDYGPDNSILSFASEDPCYHQKGGAIDLDIYGKYRFLSANMGLLLEANKKKTVHNFCVNINDFSSIKGLTVQAGGDHYGLVSSANLVNQSNSQNAVNPLIAAKSITLNKNKVSCLKILPNVEFNCSSQGLDLLTMAIDATGSTIPDDCEPYTYKWTGPNGFTSTDANPFIPAGSSFMRSGDFTVIVKGANGCRGKSTFCFNQYYCSSGAQKTTITEQSSKEENVKHILVSNGVIMPEIGQSGNRIDNTASSLELGDLILNNSDQIQIYPNPTDASTMILCDVEKFNKYQVVNALGQVLGSQRIESSMFELNLESYEDGIYYLQLSGDHEQANKSILKQ